MGGITRRAAIPGPLARGTKRLLAIGANNKEDVFSTDAVTRSTA